MFHVGQLVACVDAEGSNILTRGTVYTVSAVLPHNIWEWRGNLIECVAILLEEVLPSPDSLGFSPFRFRPVNPKRIEVFTSLLVTPPREDVSA